MASTSQSTLDRRLGPLDAAAIIVANVIGGGILFTPPLIAASVPHPWWFLATWLTGGALAFAGAVAYAELAALRPLHPVGQTNAVIGDDDAASGIVDQAVQRDGAALTSFESMFERVGEQLVDHQPRRHSDVDGDGPSIHLQV